MGGPLRVEVAVRELVELVWRTGDLRAEPGLRASPLVGIRGHQWIQRSRPAGYRAEVPLAKELTRGYLIVRAAGRADGLEPDRDPPLLEEIKTVSRPPMLLTEDSHPLHWAQAEVYAAIHAEQTGARALDVQLTYLHPASGEVRTFTRRRTAAELARFLDQTLARLLSWVEPLLDWRAVRDDSIRGLAFPYPAFRAGQRELADAVHRAIAGGRRLFAQAPTGTGKTVAVVLGALEALARGHASQLFFLTAKTTGRAAAHKAFDDLRAAGLAARTLTLTARDAICPHPDRACAAGDCPLAAGHYDRIGEAVRSLLEGQALDRNALERRAAAARVCPFLLSIAALPWCDAVICDMNYVFDPRVSPKVMESIAIGRRAFLVDETHNLVDRAREMFSAELVASELRGALGRARSISAGLARAVEDAIAAIEAAGDPATGAEPRWQLLEDLPPGLLDALERIVDDVEARLADPAARPDGEIAELYFRAHGFARLARKPSDRHALFVEGRGRRRRIAKFCVDPSEDLQVALGRRSPAVFFSATLSPLGYFSRVLGGSSGCDELCFGSPFPPENLAVVLADRVSTRFRDRAASLDRVVGLIAAAFRAHPANQMAYLSSYEYLELVSGRFAELHPDVPCAAQSPGMDEAERRQFLERFTSMDQGPVLGFAVLGGAFGEGIDLVGEDLSGAIVVGPGLPAICAERELIRDHFARAEGSRDAGFEFAYLFPGIGRVLQAAGRVIRSETDRGAIVLVGQRFAEPRFSRLLPPEWGAIARAHDETELARCLEAFWAPKGT